MHLFVSIGIGNLLLKLLEDALAVQLLRGRYQVLESIMLALLVPEV